MSGLADPFAVVGPALVAFSGGRTSAYMLRRILDAHHGKLPADVHVTFANTGKEREETLRFVHECGSRWGVRINWLEWRSRLKSVPVERRFEIVGYNSASRNGEPFAALIESKKAVPNAVARWCTEHLKMQVMADFMEALGYAHWTNVVGLRNDEMRRVAKKAAQNQTGTLPWTSIMPLVRTGITRRDVCRFWFGQDRIDLTIPAAQLPQGFDLGLESWEGNCDDCMLKPWAVLVHQERLRPGTADWWSEQEERTGARFVTEYSFADVQREVVRSPLLVPLEPDDLDRDSECGISGVDARIRCGAKRP